MSAKFHKCHSGINDHIRTYPEILQYVDLTAPKVAAGKNVVISLTAYDVKGPSQALMLARHKLLAHYNH